MAARCISKQYPIYNFHFTECCCPARGGNMLQWAFHFKYYQRHFGSRRNVRQNHLRLPLCDWDGMQYLLLAMWWDMNALRQKGILCRIAYTDHATLYSAKDSDVQRLYMKTKFTTFNNHPNRTVSYSRTKTMKFSWLVLKHLDLTFQKLTFNT